MPDQIVLKTLRRVGDVADQTVASLEGTAKKLERLLITRAGEITETKLVDVALARAQIGDILTESGYYAEIQDLLDAKYQELIDAAYEKYLDRFPDKEFQFSTDSLSRLEALQQLDLTQFSGLGDDLAQTLTRGIIDYQAGAVTKDALVQLIADSAGEFAKHAGTWVQTAVFGYYQEANNLLAVDAGIEKFEYVGPDDDITREFCQEILDEDREWTREEITELDNGQGLSVWTYGGGYNCRHTWEAARG